MLQKKGLKNVLIVVTRYFGGILLGTGGLVRAYTEAAKQGLKNAEIIELKKTKNIVFEFSYELKDKILFYLKKEEYEDKEIFYGENVRIMINIPEEDEKVFLEKLIEITEGKVEIID
jgi:putative IMPACT (imprinted ancient) family translation regulator